MLLFCLIILRLVGREGQIGDWVTPGDGDEAAGAAGPLLARAAAGSDDAGTLRARPLFTGPGLSQPTLKL